MENEVVFEATAGEIAAAFNEWMRQYVEEPERFVALARSIRDFLASEGDGSTPTYGDECAATLRNLILEARAV